MIETEQPAEHNSAGGIEKSKQMANLKAGPAAINNAWLFMYAAALLGMIGWLNFITADDRQFSRLAESFLEGKLYLLPTSLNSWADTALFNGYHYSPFGPLPAVLIIPLVWSGYFHQGQLSFLVTLCVFYLCFRLARGSSILAMSPAGLRLHFVLQYRSSAWRRLHVVRSSPTS